MEFKQRTKLGVKQGGILWTTLICNTIYEHTKLKWIA